MQLASVLSEFPEDVVIYVTSPDTGIQRRSKWPPTISEVLEACEARQEIIWKLKNNPPLKRLSRPVIDRSPGSLAQVHVPEWHERYSALVEWTKDANDRLWKFGVNSDGEPGLWVCSSAWAARTAADLAAVSNPALNRR